MSLLVIQERNERKSSALHLYQKNPNAYFAVHVLQHQVVAVVLHGNQADTISYSELLCERICPCNYVFPTQGGTGEPSIVNLGKTEAIDCSLSLPMGHSIQDWDP